MTTSANSAPKVSDKQFRILEYIASFLSAEGFPPTIREICKAVQISSTSVANYNLDKLEAMGLISRRREVSRGLTLNWPILVDLGILSPPENGADGADAGQEERSDLFRVPLLGHIAAGEPIMVEPRDLSNVDEWVDVAQTTFKLSGSPKDYFALRVKGDSMIDASVLDGDIVILRHQATAENGEMVAAWIEDDGETTLKHLYKEGKKVRLQPANPNFDPIVRNASQVRINGKVVSVMRYLN
ncbi:MAG: transcriptional repressor LexA [Caldilineaceae bacterium]